MEIAFVHVLLLVLVLKLGWPAKHKGPKNKKEEKVKRAKEMDKATKIAHFMDDKNMHLQDIGYIEGEIGRAHV